MRGKMLGARVLYNNELRNAARYMQVGERYFFLQTQGYTMLMSSLDYFNMRIYSNRNPQYQYLDYIHDEPVVARGWVTRKLPAIRRAD